MNYELPKIGSVVKLAVPDQPKRDVSLWLKSGKDSVLVPAQSEAIVLDTHSTYVKVKCGKLRRWVHVMYCQF
jgi:hypothetical protein